jgi:D-hydroxyproline dehydrogenase subunit alpha
VSVNSYHIAVIGGGPAGIAAATTAAKQGASVLLLDSEGQLGGHYYKRLPESFSGALAGSDRKYFQEIRQREALLQDTKVKVLTEVRVWGVFHGSEISFSDKANEQREPEFTLYFNSASEQTQSATVQAIILAPGVYDRPLPFPGWTLPGVLTPGAAQMMIKRQGLLPGKRVLMAGSGPLQMAVAANLAREGAQITAFLDVCRINDGARLLPAGIWGQWERLSEMAGYLFTLLRKRVPIFFGYGVRRAEGTLEEGVQAVVIGPVDATGRPVAGYETRFEVDTLCASYGFLPAINLSLHLGCSHDYHPQLGAYIPRYDERMETDQANVFVAGDVTGVAGKPMAELQGKVAGISVLERLGFIAPQEAHRLRTALQPAMQHEGRFARFLWQRFRFRPGILDALDDGTVLCRCENVTLGDLRSSYADGALTLSGSKLRTRMGMGICQGRYCTMNAAILLAGMTGKTVPEVGLMKIRPPVVPVRMRNICLDEPVDSIQ